jgi:methyltransferase (TIGR00027 family)
VVQYVSLGAGLDTFPYRQPAWAGALRIFEVDGPATQDEKRRRLARAGVPVPGNVTFVPIDFETAALPEVLAAHGFDGGAPTFVAWLGVTMYLTWPAIDAVFHWVRTLPAGSEIVFTFSPSADAVTRSDGGPTLADRVAAQGEPFVTHVAPEDLTARLEALGLSVTLLTPAAIASRYLGERTDGLVAPRRITIASARVADAGISSASS